LVSWQKEIDPRRHNEFCYAYAGFLAKTYKPNIEDTFRMAGQSIATEPDAGFFFNPVAPSIAHAAKSKLGSALSRSLSGRNKNMGSTASVASGHGEAPASPRKGSDDSLDSLASFHTVKGTGAGTRLAGDAFDIGLGVIEIAISSTRDYVTEVFALGGDESVKDYKRTR